MLWFVSQRWFVGVLNVPEDLNVQHVLDKTLPQTSNPEPAKDNIHVLKSCTRNYTMISLTYFFLLLLILWKSSTSALPTSPSHISRATIESRDFQVSPVAKISLGIAGTIFVLGVIIYCVSKCKGPPKALKEVDHGSFRGRRM